MKKSHGHNVYNIPSFAVLCPYLGEQWHLRVINTQLDFCYVILGTVQFHLHRRCIVADALSPKRTIDGGYSLVFRFVRGDSPQ